MDAIIINKSEVIENIIDILKDSEINPRNYQVDVYAYYNAETKIVKIDTFCNVGGNSWIDDDHIFVCAIKERFNDIDDAFFNGWHIDDYANTLDIDVDALINRSLDYFDGYDRDDIGDSEIAMYVWTVPEFSEKLNEYYKDYILTDSGVFESLCYEAENAYKTIHESVFERIENGYYN